MRYKHGEKQNNDDVVDDDEADADVTWDMGRLWWQHLNSNISTSSLKIRLFVEI